MLTLAGCRERQRRFLDLLAAADLDAAVISHPRDIYYLTGLLPEGKWYFPNVLFLGPGRSSWMVTGAADGEAGVDELIRFPLAEMATMNSDHHRRAGRLVREKMAGEAGVSRLGYQHESLPFAMAREMEVSTQRQWAPVDEYLQEMQQRKDPDELECLRRAIRATLAGYSRAQQLIVPGISELEVMTECQASAQRHSGQEHFYNGDFRSGQPGGFARARKIERGELYIIDAWSDLGGYWCDMSRTWIVGGEPTDLQISVFEHLAEILADVPNMARPGRHTTDFWRELDERVREHPHLSEIGLPHHGGHGIGLRPHEAPDLNRDRGGILQVGTTFTCEPGCYTEELRAGVRLENDFVVTETGAEVLVPYPVTLQPDPSCPVP